MTKVFSYRSQTYLEEAQFADKWLRFAYTTIVGRLLLKTIFITPFIWRAYAMLQRSSLSGRKMRQFITHHRIDPRLYHDAARWRSFNDVFTRQLVASPTIDDHVPFACAEAHVMTASLSDDCQLHIKQREYQLADIIGSAELAREYRGGIAVVYRLAMHHYHRFLFPAGGKVVSQREYRGVLHTVSSLSEGYPVYSINKRTVTVLQTERAGKITMIEIGAMMVGDIVQHPVVNPRAGQEKGFFQIGGSTIIVVYEKDKVRIDPIITLENGKGVEVTVSLGQAIGTYV